jgi:anti-sigma B factor antagonist
MELDVRTYESPDPYTVVAVAGELDVGLAPQLKARLVELITDGATDLVVDLSAVQFIDSTGLGVLIRVLRQLRERGGDLKLVVTRPDIMRIFEITGLGDEFCISDSLSGLGAC